jgi:hypothetical protein
MYFTLSAADPIQHCARIVDGNDASDLPDSVAKLLVPICLRPHTTVGGARRDISRILFLRITARHDPMIDGQHDIG